MLGRCFGWWGRPPPPPVEKVPNAWDGPWCVDRRCFNKGLDWWTMNESLKNFLEVLRGSHKRWVVVFVCCVFLAPACRVHGNSTGVVFRVRSPRTRTEYVQKKKTFG